VIRARQREGGILGGDIRHQGRVGKGQVKHCGLMVAGERAPSVDPGCVEARQQVSRCSVELRGTYKLVVIGE